MEFISNHKFIPPISNTIGITINVNTANDILMLDNVDTSICNIA